MTGSDVDAGVTDAGDTENGSGAVADSGGTDDDARPRVLVVDDEERVGQAFALWLKDSYRVETATSGTEGLEKLTDDTDVVLLDRHMPGLSGTEVLERIREAGYDCRVAMVTAVDPDLDIVDLPFDDYVSKPVDRETLRTVIDRIISLDQYDRRMGELYAVDRTIAALQADMPGRRLEDDDRYRELRERKAKLETEMNELIGSLDPSEMPQLFETVIGGDAEPGDAVDDSTGSAE